MMDIVLVCMVAAVLILSHMAAYHLGGIKACDNIQRTLKAVRRYKNEEVDK